MNKDYIIYESISDEISENNIQLAEKMIIEKLQQKSCRRVIVRPKIKVGKDILMMTASLVATILFLFLVHSIFHILNNAIFILLCIISGIIWFVFNLKRLLLTIITLYQKYAPEKMRSACLFEPCCSEYMKRAVIKYGVISGTIKGIKRICRCRYPNGGIDEP